MFCSPKPLMQVLDPQTGDLSHVFVHASCSSKRVAVGAAATAQKAAAAGGEMLMGKIQRQLLLQVLPAALGDA